MESQICISCKKEKVLTDFYKSPTCKTGYDTKCIECKRNYAKQWRQSENGKLVNKKSKVKLKVYDMWYFAKLRAKRKNIQFTITKEDIVIPETCPIFNIPIVKTNIKQEYNSPSIDRIDNTKGYTKDNIIIISWKANNIKSISSLEDINKIITYLTNNKSQHIFDYYPKEETYEKIIKMWYDAKYRARDKGLLFDIEKYDIVIPKKCPILGIDINLSHDNKIFHNTSPSLDRIDNAKGYTKDNICVISWMANKIKNFGTLNDFIKIRDYLTNIKK